MVDTLTWCWGFQTKINRRRFAKVYIFFVFRCLVRTDRGCLNSLYYLPINFDTVLALLCTFPALVHICISIVSLAVCFLHMIVKYLHYSA